MVQSKNVVIRAKASIKIRLHTDICQARFLFWLVQINKSTRTACNSDSLLRINCNVSTNFHTPESESQPTKRSVKTYQKVLVVPPGLAERIFQFVFESPLSLQCLFTEQGVM